MANHVTNVQRQRLYAAAELFTKLDDDGEIVAFRSAAQTLAAQEHVSVERARGAIARCARRMRHPDYQEKPLGRPVVLPAAEPVTVYLPATLIAKATKLGNGNVSEGVRLALEGA